MAPYKRLKHKYGAVSCERHGIKFPSKLERSVYTYLKDAQSRGELLFFLRQVPFDLPGNRKHVVDFCIFFKEHVVFVEAKGRDLAMGKLKREQVENIYGIDVMVVGGLGQLHDIVQENKD